MNGLFDHLAERAATFGGSGSPTVLTCRPDALVVRAGDVVVKAHRADNEAFATRLELVATELAHVFVAPLGDAPWFSCWNGWHVTGWPSGEAVDPETPWTAPWTPIGVVLAELHRHPVRRTVPAARTVTRIERAIAELANSDVAATGDGHMVLSAAATLESIGQSGTSLIHGDFHLGQVARFGDRGWLLLDPDDLGTGDPRWDFARPASWFAIGLISTEEWRDLVESYRDAGGNAIRDWADIDSFARAFTVHAAARSVTKAVEESRETTDIEREFITACARIADR